MILRLIYDDKTGKENSVCCGMGRYSCAAAHFFVVETEVNGIIEGEFLNKVLI